MPIPTPNSGESQNDFMGRCMSAMKKEFPDQKQRTAVCFSKWRKKKGECFSTDRFDFVNANDWVDFGNGIYARVSEYALDKKQFKE